MILEPEMYLALISTAYGHLVMQRGQTSTIARDLSEGYNAKTGGLQRQY